MDVLTADRLTLGRAGAWQLDEVSLALQAGERVAVLGANGAGKSTLLRCLAGELTPRRGSVLLAQRPLAHWRGSARAQRLAVMPQQVTVGFPLTALEVVLLGRSPFQDEGKSRQAVEQVMATLQCWHLRARRYPLLSGGEQQRVQLARVMLQLCPLQGPVAEALPRVLLLDECTSAQDPARQHHILDWLRQIAARSALGMVAVMHDLSLAVTWAQRVVLLKQGRVIASGPVELLADAAVLAQVYDLPPQLSARYAEQNAHWLACTNSREPNRVIKGAGRGETAMSKYYESTIGG